MKVKHKRNESVAEMNVKSNFILIKIYQKLLVKIIGQMSRLLKMIKKTIYRKKASVLARIKCFVSRYQIITNGNENNKNDILLTCIPRIKIKAMLKIFIFLISYDTKLNTN